MSDWNTEAGASDWVDDTDNSTWQEPAAPGVEGFEGVQEGGRQSGVVKRWNDKGFGFIEPDDGRDSVFCHATECPTRAGLVPGSKVSFIFEADEKGGKARQVQIEEAAPKAEPGSRETGSIKSWNTEKGFGFIGRDSGEPDAFVHKRDCGGAAFAQGQTLSFVVEEGPKGAAAKEVQAEEGGFAQVAAPEEEEGSRQLGKVKSYNEEKGFAFIAPCTGGEDLFTHKKEFRGIEPRVGQPVSYIVEATEKGDAAKKVREEESVPEPVLSDEGREFGKVKNFMSEKGFGFISWKGGEEAIVFDKETNGIALQKGMDVSFKFEEGAKGPLAKDLRLEDPARVARVTAKVHYGKVESYFEPTAKKPTNGYGFIIPFESQGYGAVKKYYFHMSELEDPDEEGGIEPDTNVSFIVTAARKGVQAVAVKIADPPKKEEDGHNGVVSGFGDLQVSDPTDAPAYDPWGPA